ncbi:MAG: trypsin-like peptidase domain-containing protein [Planctomycetia bacterium]|nr:trypsin-like peptidase domain-containing protein [Planctomycetia bacterium]
MSIQIIINGRVMKSGPLFIFFLFLTACLLIPVLPNRSEKSEEEENTGQPCAASATSEPETSAEASVPAVAPVVPSALPLAVSEPLAADPIATEQTSAVVQSEEPTSPNPVEFHEVALDSEAAAAEERNLFVEVASPYISEDNRPKPITVRGNLAARAPLASNPNVVSGQSSGSPSTSGLKEYVQAPQPLNQQRVPATSVPEPSAGQPVKPLAAATPRDYDPIAPTSFDSIAPRIPLPESLRGPNASYDAIFDYMTETLRQSVAYARPAVVHIEARVHKANRGTKEYEETGGGVLALIQNRYFVITNGHVAGDPVSLESVRILLANQKTIHPIRVLTCPDIDIALLEISGNDLPSTVMQPGSEVTVARFGDSDKVKIPDTVLTIGSPFGLAGSVSKGIVGGLERRKIPLGNSPDQIQNFIQTDAAINPGNSGGPLLNTSGEVIGIVTAIASNTGANEGVGLALPINTVLRVATQLVTDGVYRRPYMGVELDPQFGEKERQSYGLIRPVGTRVVQITPGSPADRVGLRQGDVILTYNGTVVQDDQHLVQLISLSKVGDAPQISILRDRKEVYLTPLLGNGVSTAMQ